MLVKYKKKNQKKTNDKKVPKYTWTPSSDQYQPDHYYHKEFSIDPVDQCGFMHYNE